MGRILVTGSEGLVGQALKPALERGGFHISPFDLQLDRKCDITDFASVRGYVHGCQGIIHLAAVTRIVEAEENPQICWATNVLGTSNLLRAAVRTSDHRPWVIFASSREVYGEPPRLPVVESLEPRPINHYGHSKHLAEQLVLDAAKMGLGTAILRFSNVYGSIHDYPDRVVPAFARAAVIGEPLRVNGRLSIFDFTHVADVVNGIMLVVERLQSAERSLPILHLTTGIGTSLEALAAMALSLARSSAPIHFASARSNDVSRFIGDPGLAMNILGWSARVPLSDGVSDMVSGFRELVQRPMVLDPEALHPD